ncbi:MAG: response regulator transcription factor [Pseudomonadota bacterium]
MSFCWISNDGAPLPQWVRDLALSDEPTRLEWQQPVPPETQLAVLDGRQYRNGYDHLPAYIARQRSFPVIIANVEIAPDRVALLEAGADEVLSFDIDDTEALARARRMISLYQRLADKTSDKQHYGTLRFDHAQQKLWREHTPIFVTRREFALVACLAKAGGRAVSKHELYKAVFNLSFDPGTNVLAVHIYRLRKKLQQGFITQILRTVEGRGYALVKDQTVIEPLGDQTDVRNRANHA